jgi:hypothetical protein
MRRVFWEVSFLVRAALALLLSDNPVTGMGENVIRQCGVSESREVQIACPIPDIGISSPTVSCVATISTNWVPVLDQQRTVNRHARMPLKDTKRLHGFPNWSL